MYRSSVVLFLALVASFVSAQQEVLMPLTMRPMAEASLPKNEQNSVFLYQFDTLGLPIMDDFSIDRTRKRWTQPGDEGVVLDAIHYHLAVGGVSEPDMAFAQDTTFTYITDVGEEIITTRTALPQIEVLITDLDVHPVESELVLVWPPYNIYDTIQAPSPDTLFIEDPDLVQDSLFVYVVPPDQGIYLMNNVPTPLILWEDDDVYVNGTYPVAPPSIGVATFDGLSRTGIPYDFMNYSSHGIADRLTSVPIDLQRPASDSIYFSFFYQARGFSGDQIGQPIDSLLLEFYAPLEDTWTRVWSRAYNALLPDHQPPFRQVMIPIKEFKYLQKGFRMRFSNYATLSGSFDHWHLDYVRLAAQRAHDDTTIVDVAYLYPPATMLETYTSVPYNKFELSPATLMANSIVLPQRNLDVNDRFIDYGFRAGTYGGPLQNFDTGTNTFNNASSVFPSEHPIVASGFVYDAPPEEDARFYDVRFWTNATPDFNRYNDTARFIQEISNYYSYDDGTAEGGYGLTNAPGGRVAYRFDLLGPDSLRAIRMYFNPMANLPPSPHPTTGSFLVTVWSSLSPEVIQHQNFSFSSPEYRSDGINKFVEFPLDSAIYVEGTIYVGWVQTNNVNLNVGFDRNRNNQGRISYNVGGNWNTTSFEGSLMLRPVMVSPVDPWTGIGGTAGGGNEMSLHPNPASEGFWLAPAQDPQRGMVECRDATGRLIWQESYMPGHYFSTSTMANGVYLLRLTDASGAEVARTRLMVQR